MNRPTSVIKGKKVAIIGAGVSGLGIGWRLAEAGCNVEVFDRGEAGSGASWAAAGMLAARAEAEPGEEALLLLNLRAQEVWPVFAEQLEAASGRSIGYRDEGTLIIASTRDDAEQLRFNYEYQKNQGLDVEWLNAAQVHRREPYLAPGLSGGVYSPSDHQVDNRELSLALKDAFHAAGGKLNERARVDKLAISGGRAKGVIVSGTVVDADIVVLAAGAWSRDLDGLPDEVRPPVRPLKGQMIALRMDPNFPLLRHVLWAPEGIYLVPRLDGRLIVGATVEEKGFDENLTAGGLLHLLREAWEVLPGIDELPFDEMWAGFRPTSRDDAPILGPTEIEGLVIATGHHRNGILLAPITANAVSNYILTRELSEEIKPFGPGRFRRRPAVKELQQVGAAE
ncbi:MAG: Glycine oxidase [Alphaproteobacteria bacterium MarineAlpha4_Bin2]|nr:MAG: Glycine oxidase [Alphaproteobacteria bacterium MarineAlpha4_Bin2]